MAAVQLPNAVVTSTVSVPIPTPAPGIDNPVVVPAQPATGIANAQPFTANAIPSKLPPFPLNHPRILWDNLLINAAATSTGGTNPGYTQIPNTAQRWAFTGAQSITFTLPGAVNIDSVALGSQNLKGATVTVEYSATAASSFISFAPSKVATKYPSMMFHISSAVSATRVKITVSNAGATNKIIGSIYAGIALQMQRPFYSGHTPINLAPETSYYSSVTEGGSYIGEEIRRRGYSASPSWSNLDNDWLRYYFLPFAQPEGILLPFYFAWNLLEHPDDVGFGKSTGDIVPSLMGTRDLWTVSMDIRGFS